MTACNERVRTQKKRLRVYDDYVRICIRQVKASEEVQTNFFLSKIISASVRRITLMAVDSFRSRRTSGRVTFVTVQEDIYQSLGWKHTNVSSFRFFFWGLNILFYYLPTNKSNGFKLYIDHLYSLNTVNFTIGLSHTTPVNVLIIVVLKHKRLFGSYFFQSYSNSTQKRNF